MNRRFLLAAELFNYSYANYLDHLGIGNMRYEKLMPETFDILDKAHREDWNNSQIAEALEVNVRDIDEWKSHYQRAKDIIDAPSAAESFRRGVRYSIEYALEEGLETEEEIELLVTQICYRAADLAVLLDNESRRLSDYSFELRRGKGIQYYLDE